jgi:RNA polymerase sigma factor (TIGR02999 family)
MAWREGDREAFEQVARLVDAELRRLARHYLRGERAGHTLQTTALVNEVWVRLLDSGRVNWQNRAHFMAVAATTMRYVLVDRARAYRYQKRGAAAVQVSLGEVMIVAPERLTDIVAIHEALERLAEFNANAARAVELRFFGGFQNKEVAEVLGVSEVTATRYCNFARSWLERELVREEKRGEK